MTVAIRSIRPDQSSKRQKTFNIGLLCPHDLSDRNAFSGTAYFAAEALEAQPDIQIRRIAPPPRTALDRILRRSQKMDRPDRASFVGLDAVIGLVASRLVPFLPSGMPFIHVTDATPAFLRDTYGWAQQENAESVERAAVARASRVVYSSAAMAARAPNDLGLPSIGSAVLPFGVNFDTLPVARPEKSTLDAPRLLFVGSDWERKGGDMALSVLDRLRATGCDATLTVVGPVPERITARAGLRVVGYLDKNRLSDATRLSQLYAEAHLLILPTRGDCTPMVIAEAMAHGTPVLVTDTGGVADVIGGDGAGRALFPDATVENWVFQIREMLASQTNYEFSSDSAFDRARNALVWSAWARGIVVLARAAAMERALAVA